MSTGTAARPEIDRANESAEERFERLRREAREQKPQSIGTAGEIERDTVGTLKAFRRTRKRASKIA